MSRGEGGKGEVPESAPSGSSGPVLGVRGGSPQECLTALLGQIECDDPQLAELIRAWPSIPEEIKAVILAAAETATNKARN
jgi:hypothetical protein